jgi:hypothetical protein
MVVKSDEIHMPGAHEHAARAEPVTDMENARREAERRFLLARDAYYRETPRAEMLRDSRGASLTTPDLTDIVRAT